MYNAGARGRAPDAPEGIPMVKKSSKDGSADSFMQVLARTYHGVAAAFEREAGVSQARLQILANLRSQEELSQSELQQRLDVDGAAITRQVKQLEAEGLVQRRSSPTDQRFTLVALTAQGRRLAEQVVRKRDAFEARLHGGLVVKDVATTTKTLDRLRDAAKPRAKGK